MSQNNDIIYQENVLYKHNKEDIYGTLLLYSDKLIFRSNDIPNFNIELNSIIKFSRTKYNSIEFVCNNASYTFSFLGKINQFYAIIMSQLKKHGYQDIVECNSKLNTPVSIKHNKSEKNSDIAKHYYELGNKYYDNCDYKNAVEAYKKCVEADPISYLSVLLDLGDSYKKLEKYKEALESYSMYIEFGGDKFDRFFERAYCNNNTGKADLALADYTKVIQLDPEECSAYNNRGLIYKEKGELGKAISDFTKAIELKSEALYYSNRAECYMQLEEYNKAITDFTKAIKLNPDTEKYFDYRADCYIKLASFDNAVSDYTKLIELNPKPYYYQRRIYCNEQLENNKAIILDYEILVEKNPSEYLARGEYYKEQGQYAKAIEDLSRYIKLNPDELDNEDLSYNYYNIAECYNELGQYEEAILNYTKAIKLDNNDWTYYRDRADCYKELEKYEEAIADYSEAIRLNPESNYSIQKRGQCYKELKQYKEAIEDFANAIELKPDWWGFYKDRADCYKELEQHELAITDYTKAIELNKNSDILSYLHRANCYVRLNKINEAVADFELLQTLTDNESVINACKHCIELSQQQEKALEAKSDLAEALKELDIDMTVEEYVEYMKYREDIDKYTEILQAEPDNAEVYFDRGKANLMIFNHREAVKDFITSCILDETKLEIVKSTIYDISDKEEIRNIFINIEETLNSVNELSLSKTEKINFVRKWLSSMPENKDNIDISKILDTNSTKGRKLDL